MIVKASNGAKERKETTKQTEINAPQSKEINTLVNK